MTANISIIAFVIGILVIQLIAMPVAHVVIWFARVNPLETFSMGGLVAALIVLVSVFAVALWSGR